MFALVLILPVRAIGEKTSQLPGRLAVVGDDYNVYAYDLLSSSLTPVTDNASTLRHYVWPTWSTDGRLAFFCCDTRASMQRDAEVFISPDGIQPAANVFSVPDISIIYAYWSPQNCDDGTDCRDLALLVSDFSRGDLGMQVLRNRVSGSSLQGQAYGSPFYYHWNATGTQMIFHRNNRDVTIYDVESGSMTDVETIVSSGLYQTPAWSSVDDRQVFGVRNADGRSTDLVVVDGTTTRTLLEAVDGFLSFALSPDGKYVAYRVIVPDGTSPIHIMDMDTSEIVGVNSVDDIYAFFWSPDSQKIAYVTAPEGSDRSASVDQTGYLAKRIPAQNQQSAPQLLWNVYDVTLGIDTVLADFVPTYEMGYLLTYFDQFAPSHRIWSPDSQALVYSAVTQTPQGELQSEVYITLIDAPGEPVRVSGGVFAVWSYE
jgi:TolB protein